MGDGRRKGGLKSAPKKTILAGLLRAEDVAHARKTHPKMPRSRELLAVPFVGKDRPSEASEFSHPDVVIGLTIMAYRYEVPLLVLEYPPEH